MKKICWLVCMITMALLLFSCGTTQDSTDDKEDTSEEDGSPEDAAGEEE